VSILAWQVHQFDVAMQYTEQIAVLAHSNGRKDELAFSFNVKGRIYIEQGDYDGAETALQESAQLAHQFPHLFSPGRPLAQLGELALARGDLDTAQIYLAQAITLLAGEEEGLAVGIYVAIARTALAEIALAHGNYAQARHELSQIFTCAGLHARRLQCLLVTFTGLLLATLHTTQIEDAQTAAALLGAIAGMCERTGASLSPMHQALIQQRSDYAQRLLTQREWQVAWQTGHSWTFAQTVAEIENWLG
jgi:tetratricopeptide (TPR) repeat protein